MRDRKKRNIIIGVLCCLLVFMGIGYAILSQTLTINGIGNVKGNWNVEITNIELKSQTGKATEVSSSYTNTTASFEADLYMPGDSIEYEVTVTNNGNIDAVLQSIIPVKTNNISDILFTNSTIKEVLSAGETAIFTMKVEFLESAEAIPDVEKTEYKIELNYVQYDGVSEYIPPIQTSTLVGKVLLLDNIAQSDSSIDFSQISSDTNGKGLYYTSTNTEGNATTYYFRGDVDNNYVEFAGKMWRIVRINEDGSTRLITDRGVVSSAFNSCGNNAYVGYMYGTASSTTYEATHANTNDSKIKTYLDNWYQENLLSYTSYMSVDAGFCNDRSMATTANTWFSDDTALGYGTNKTYYGSTNRLYNTKQPQFACPQTNDLFTTSTSSKGNKALTYPVGLITADEVVYAGGTATTTNSTYYLNNNVTYWTMSPMVVIDSSYIASLNSDGSITIEYCSYLYSVRPVINLASNVEIISGDGTIDNPYVVK